MQAFVSKLMAVLVLAQAVSGWCCHRPCHCLEGEAAEETSTAVKDSCCHDDHESLALEVSSHCQCHECQGFCTYVAGAKSQIVPPQTMAGLDIVAASSDAAHTLLVATRSSQTSASIVHLGPPVRLHLLHQSLLI